MREETILSPSQVSGYIKSWMDRDRLLSGLLVRGELSNYKMYPSGHHYFTLKDSQGALRCVMFRGDAASLRFRPENGMQVIAAGRITVFPRDGQYQLYCVRLTPEGAGDLHVAFEQLKEKLLREGLFDQAHKRPLPAYPRRIALITSPAGAAVRDMLRILGARYPLAQVRVLPVRVQGEGAAEEIAAQGGRYTVSAGLEETEFPTREYDGFALPSGEYLALRVVIGEGAGKNWWCVVFPPLCTTAACDFQETAVSGGLGEEDLSLITEEDGGYVLRFRAVELWEGLRQWLGKH